MGNRSQRPIAIAETDMAALADGRLAVEDLEGLLLKLGYRPVVTEEDAQRLAYNLQRVRLGLGVVDKFLRLMRAIGWEAVAE
jgi:hypothetical protein